MSVTSLGHDPFMNTLRQFAEHGATRNERELAQITLDLYQLTSTHPLVVHYVDEFTLKATA